MSHVIYFITLLNCFVISAQELTQTIKGQIVDQQSKTPIIGATVIIKNSDPTLGGVTDIEGYYRIENVPVGRQTLLFSSIGYESSAAQDIVVQSGKEVIINTELQESFTQMEEVVVSASSQGKGQIQNEMATISAISFSVEETSRYPAAVNDPARMALSFAGVTGGGDDLSNEIVIRGNTPKGLLWRLEGVEIPNPNHYSQTGSSAGGISMLSSAMLSNSDFYTGAFPAQYGNASSGVFDLKLRKGNYDKRETTFQAGILGFALASEGPLSKKSRASYLINYRYSNLAVFTALGINIVDPTETVEFQDLSFKIHIPSKKFGSFALWGLGGHNVDNEDANAEDSIFFWSDGKQSIGVFGITNINYLSNKTYLETILSTSGNRSRDLLDTLTRRLEYKEKISEYAHRVSLMLNHKFSVRSSVRIGTIYSHLGYNMFETGWQEDNTGYEVYLDAEGTGNMGQAYMQWQYRPNSRLTLTPGFHLTYFDINKDTYLEPRLGARYQLNTTTNLNLGFGSHTRRETIALYRSQEEQPDGSFLEHNRDLSFTRANHYVLGYEKMLRPNVRLKLETYYQKLFDVPVYFDRNISDLSYLIESPLNSNDGYTSAKLANNGTGENYGFEIGVEKFFSSNYFLLSNLSFYESMYTGADGIRRNTRYNGNFIYNLVGGKEFKVGKSGNNLLNINGKIIWAGSQRFTPINLEQSIAARREIRNLDQAFESRLDNYFRIDLGINFRVNRRKYSYIIDFSVQNVMHRENEANRFYSDIFKRIMSDTQLGILPNINYKLEF